MIWILNGILVCGALASYLAFAGQAALPQPFFHLTWWMLAILFYLTEIWVLPLHFRRDSHLLSFSEVPLVLGLYFSSPSELMLGLGLGAGTALVIHRRQPPVKLIFNFGHMLMAAGLSLFVFRLLVSGGINSAVTWPAAFLATTVSAIFGVTVIATAISLNGGHSRLRRVFGLAVIGSLTNTSLALVAIIVLNREPTAVWLLLMPTATLFAAYRAYTSARQKHKSVEFLYQSSQLFQNSTELEPTLVAMLGYLHQMFRTEMAEITLLVDSGERPLRTTVRMGREPEVMEPVDATMLRTLIEHLNSSRKPAQTASDSSPAVTAYVSSRGLRNAMVTPLRREGQLIGIIAVANRQSVEATFDAEDVRLFEALAGQVGTLLENGHLEQSLSQLRQLEEELKHQAFHDPLTRLANRARFIERVEHALARWDRNEHPVAVLILDLDDFQSFNDRLGHVAGDRLLVEVADRLRSCLRPADTAARLGGDEFAIVLSEVGGVPAARIMAHQILTALAKPFEIGEHQIRVEASIGVAVERPDSIRADQLLRNADIAMHAAKNGGKGCAQIFEAGMEAKVLSRHQLRVDLQAGLDRGEFILNYQPIVRIASGRITGFEALVRWNHPSRGPIPPLEFIPLAEESGVILDLGAWILKQACHQAVAWRTVSPDNAGLTMSVNLSARQLQHRNLIDTVTEALEESGLEASGLVLEITENAMIEDTKATLTQFERLKALGVRLAIDDFGTGYSSLSWLRRFPVDILKIAKPFVDGLGGGPDETAFLKAIAELGRTLRMEMVAEGIERPIQVEQLRSLKLGLGQGFYYAMPLTSANAELLLADGPLGSEFAFA